MAQFPHLISELARRITGTQTIPAMQKTEKIQLSAMLTDAAGVTYTYTDNSTRSATDGTNTETQKITPAYNPGDWIYALPLPVGSDTSLSNGKSTNFIDINSDGRAWAAS